MIGPALAAMFLLVARGVVRDRAAAYPALAQTAFGPVAVTSDKDARRLERLIARIHSVGMHHIYCHTYCSQLSLFTGLPNPTRYELLLPGMSEQPEFEAIRDFLKEARDPVLGVGLVGRLNRQRDPALEWIEENYVFHDNTPAFALWRRKDLAPGPVRSATNAPLQEPSAQPVAGP